MGWHTNPYMGMVFVIILLMFFIAGLILIPISLAAAPASGRRQRNCCGPR